MYLIFILLLFFIYRYATKNNNSDYANPSTVLTCLFFIAALFALYLYYSWELYNYQAITVVIFITGIIAFCIGCGMVKRPASISLNGINQYNNNQIIRIDIYSAVFGASVLIVLVAIYFYYRYIMSNISIYTLNVIADFQEYRTSDDANMPGHINLLLKVASIFAHFDVFIIINNSLCGGIRIRDLKYFIKPFLYILICLISGNRGDVLQLLIAAFICWYLVSLRVNPRFHLTFRIFRKLAYVIASILVLFWASIYLLNKSLDAERDIDIMTYLCAYISGPIASFNLYLEQGGEVCKWWGQETFITLNNNLSSLFGLNVSSSRILEYRSTGSYSVVNIYSSFRRFYHDFGIIGVFVLSLIHGWIMTFLYYKTRLSLRRNVLSLSFCYYCCFFYTIPYILIDEMFYTSIVSISGLLRLVLIMVLYRFYYYDSPKKRIPVIVPVRS